MNALYAERIHPRPPALQLSVARVGDGQDRFAVVDVDGVEYLPVAGEHQLK